MTNELDWLRGKARHVASETMVVTAEQAIEGCPAGTYQVERFVFEGTVPYRMARALSGSKLTSTDTENEVLRLGNGYRGGEGRCRYYRTTYSLTAE